MDDLKDWKVTPNKDIAEALVMESISSRTANQAITQSKMKIEHWVRFITTVSIRISFIASIWLYIFNHDMWLGVIIFGIASLFTIYIPNDKVL